MSLQCAEGSNVLLYDKNTHVTEMFCKLPGYYALILFTVLKGSHHNVLGELLFIFIIMHFYNLYDHDWWFGSVNGFCVLTGLSGGSTRVTKI